MEILISYILKSTISISLIYIFYELFLKRDTWFRFNRYFLLLGLIFSIVVPTLNFSANQVLVNSQNQFEFNEYLNVDNAISVVENQTVVSETNVNVLFLLYFLVGSLFFIRIIYQIYKIYKTINANEIITYRNRKIVLLQDNSSPFSFLNYVFINKDDCGSIGARELLTHEITHSKQLHSIDVILLELLLVFQWFNPFIYRYRLAFKEIHEYLADRGVLLENSDKIGYQKLILDQIEKSFRINLASQFNYSLTKNRIKMMTRINSGLLAKIKILLVLPFIALLLMAFSINNSNSSATLNEIGVASVEYQTKGGIPSICPVEKVKGVSISSSFGMRMHPIHKVKKMHIGTDFRAPEGTPVYTTANGMVRKIRDNHNEGKGYGKYIIIDHSDGFSTLYSQLSKINVKAGQEVKQGEIIGLVGNTGMSTGSHLHYEVMKDGENVDPEKYF